MSDAENPYVLLTPGPLSTTKGVKQAMLRDWCTWDNEYNTIVQNIRRQLLHIAGVGDRYTSVLIQGSGTFSVESVITSGVPEKGKLLVLSNGVYGQRMGIIAARAEIAYRILDFGEVLPPDLAVIEKELQEDPAITHVAVVHCETTTGLLNPLEPIGTLAKRYNKIFIVDAMSSFGGIPIDLQQVQADFLISSANKCIQGVPGFGFIIARRSEIEQLENRAKSLSLDLYDQWRVMEQNGGQWRFTSPTHVVRAFDRALLELEIEGGVNKRYRRYCANHQRLMEGMQPLGFKPLLESKYQSPIITAFYNPDHPDYTFQRFYNALKAHGFVIYPGKVSAHDTFRIGTIGDITQQNIQELILAVKKSMYWKEHKKNAISVQ